MSDGSGSTAAAAASGATTLVSDQDIAEALQNILRETNPNASINLNVVVHQLQSKLGLDLSHKLDFIRNQITHFFHQAQLQAQAQAQARAAHAHYQPRKDHFALQQNPSFHPPAHFQPNFAIHRPEEYGFRPPSYQPHPPQLQPQQHPAHSHAGAPVGAEAPKGSAQTGKKRRGGPGGLNKLCGVSPELQTIVGQPTMPRTEIVRQLWAYIRKNSLQDPNNKRKIICNDELRLVFETDCTDMFKMNKLLAKHILPLDATQESKKSKVEAESANEGVDSVPIVVISEALANFFGTSEREMSQAEVLRQVWEYIKVNQLEDPLNAMAIQCDAKLQELFGCESISALGIPEMLARRHLSNKS